MPIAYGVPGTILTCLNSFISHNNLIRWILWLWFPYYWSIPQWGNWGPEWLNNLSKVTQLGSGNVQYRLGQPDSNTQALFIYLGLFLGFLLKNFFKFIYFDCTVSLPWYMGLSLWWLLLSQSTGSRAQAQELWPTGLVAPRHVESSQTKDQTCDLCIGRRIPNHWTTTKDPGLSVLFRCILSCTDTALFQYLVIQVTPDVFFLNF